MADSTIKIKTQIETKQAEVQLATLENRMQKTADKASRLREQMAKMANTKIPTQEYTEISNQIAKASKKFDELLYKQEQMVREGKAGTEAFNNIDAKLEELGNEIRYAEGELQDLVDTGKAFTLGKDTTAYSNMASQLRETEAEMDIQNQKHDILTMKQEQISSNYKKMGEEGKNAIKKINKETTKGTSALSKFATRVKSIVAALLIFNVIRKILSGVINGIKEGFSNLFENFTPLKTQVEELKASLLTLKNTFAAAFEPIVSAVIPYIQKMVEWLTKAIDMVGQFVAAIMGRKTYTKAVKQSAKASEDSAKATNKEAKALEEAEEAAEGYLSPIDEINKFTKDKTSKTPDISDATGGAGTDATATMFEEVPIDSKVLDWIDQMKEKLKPVVDYMKELWEIGKQGFFDGLGDWKTRLDSIKAGLSSIKDSFIEIWTDKQVVSGADKWAKSLAYLLGSVVGSVASIGLTIADNLVGGIAKYLEDNKDRIKKHLVAMFDIWTDINKMLSGLVQNIAYIFEAFASENGKQVTANIIGIFADAFMGVSELMSKWGRDLIGLIAKPIEENKEKLRSSLESVLGVFADLTGVIKQAVDAVMDKLNAFYDKSLKPFLDTLAGGISSAISLILALWENVLKPVVDWLINTLVPILVPMIEQLWFTVQTAFEDIFAILTNLGEVFKGVIDLITALIEGDWDAVWSACLSILENAILAILNAIAGLFKYIINIFTSIGETIVTLLVAAGKAILDAFVGIFTAIIDKVVGLFTNIKEHLSNGMGSIKEAWVNGWNALGEKLKAIWDGIVGVIKKAVEVIFGWVGKIKDAWNGLKSKVSSFFGGGSSSSSTTVSTASVSTASVPAFATGGVIPTGVGKHLAMVGDNSHETEVVSPLSTMKEAMKEAMSETGGNTVIAKLYLDGRQILESIIDAGKLEQMSSGDNVFMF